MSKKNAQLPLVSPNHEALDELVPVVSAQVHAFSLIPALPLITGSGLAPTFLTFKGYDSVWIDVASFGIIGLTICFLLAFALTMGRILPVTPAIRAYRDLELDERRVPQSCAADWTSIGDARDELVELGSASDSATANLVVERANELVSEISLLAERQYEARRLTTHPAVTELAELRTRLDGLVVKREVEQARVLEIRDDSASTYLLDQLAEASKVKELH